MAKSTFVSVLPWALRESKPGLIPGYYEVPAAEKGDIATLIVQDGYHTILNMADERAPLLRITDTSEKICQSLMMDYQFANIAISIEPKHLDKTISIEVPDTLNDKHIKLTKTISEVIALPGVFWVEGALSSSSVKIKFPHLIKQAELNTIYWFERLVKEADDDWKRYGQHKTITDIQRSAADYLGLHDKPWNYNAADTIANTCWACKTMLGHGAIICSACRAIINHDEYNRRKAEFVTT